MKEISDILKAFSAANSAGKKTALATVVKVEGSSYRQPGARMLVTEDGQLTGAISGGCLEGDALRKALLAINQQQNKLITYDTSNEDDLEFGVQLGCNGIVHILFEYIDTSKSNNPIQLLQQLEAARKDAVVVTLFSINRKSAQPGTVLFYRDRVSISNTEFDYILSDVENVIQNKTSIIKKVEVDEVIYEALIEYIAPPVALVIAGAGNDVKPLVAMASLLGWEVTIADGRATHATTQRFPQAKNVYLAKPQELITNIVVDNSTFFVLMTHNYKYDLALLKLLLETDCNYIGILGPKTKLHRMFNDLNDEGITVTDEQLDTIYGPIGLDIGAETSEEIAVSVVAEIKAVMSGKLGTSLKYKEQKIHTATLVV
ncbi:XdhC family protein [Flavobacterium zepuense]|uniref:XdhC family protein n=1 Tax=Flavobacterium zepuense TaxID=2593302 RepID=A0A552V5A4_9FLAO|nr:XdhC/CoxI family protein [Flavobacterium zepuense]TRW25656.1 XdhC family protein [Flavobacterium zepuense]